MEPKVRYEWSGDVLRALVVFEAPPKT